jgi:orotidine-5'-phosphate decarboxylase
MDGFTKLSITSTITTLIFFTIADAKRGDIGNTSSMYAKAFLRPDFDSVTVAPYMGKVQVETFSFRKHTIMLPLTSNEVHLISDFIS